MTISTSNFNSCSNFSVYVANLGAYNSGILHGSWLSLPATPDEIENCMSEVFSGRFSWDYDREYAIHDYQAPFRIEEYENVNQLSDQFERLEKAMQDSYLPKEALPHLLRELQDIERVIDSLENDKIRLFYRCNTVVDAVQEYAEECGMFDHVPHNVMSYFDWERYARDFGYEFNGTFIERIHDIPGSNYEAVIMIEY